MLDWCVSTARGILVIILTITITGFLVLFLEVLAQETSVLNWRKDNNLGVMDSKELQLCQAAAEASANSSSFL